MRALLRPAAPLLIAVALTTCVDPSAPDHTPASMTLVSGGRQTGAPGAVLPQAAIVRVVSAKGSPVSQASVEFAALAGGSVSPTIATTGPTGHASATLTLGPAVGPQSFSATIGTLSVTILATATTDPATHSLSSTPASRQPLR